MAKVWPMILEFNIRFYLVAVDHGKSWGFITHHGESTFILVNDLVVT